MALEKMASNSVSLSIDATNASAQDVYAVEISKPLHSTDIRTLRKNNMLCGVEV